ncbi:MAG: hypothetical protein A3F72_01765 [Bacteroidetes bacterium RIFCSPLOWO2_12_FULL_35_15]|nr:MAG: hypothetical protein A3F72_01765 [Bacteroidetes bacterium RIFCSPLOWO2_12_FULL_35_15]
MTEFENFHFILAHSKIEFIGIRNGSQKAPWDSEIQRNIDALYGLCDTSCEIEAHIMAAKSFFRDKLDYPKILDVVRECCKNKAGKSDFTFVFFNRLSLCK